MNNPIQSPAHEGLKNAINKANEMGLSMDDYYSAFMNAGGMNILYNWPQIQNQRVRNINTRPADISKNELAQMVGQPDSNEQSLRAASASLAFSTTTYDNILKTYADTLSYYWYIYPTYAETKGEIKAAMRDMNLVQKLVQAIDVKRMAHELGGLCQKYGKIFVTPRISVDKSHNKINYAFLQQLPTDWCKIVGYNNGPGKYTVAFNMMYFARPGTAWQQYGDLFEPYMEMFDKVVQRQPGKYVYNSKGLGARFKDFKAEASIGNPEWMATNKEIFYWVTLPADKVFTFEADDTTPLVIPPFTGMLVGLTQIPNYEAAQMELILNPLTSVLTGELETYDPKGIPNADPMRVSPGVRQYFESAWYKMLNSTNTGGIGIYLAPAKNLKLQTISDTVAGTNIAANAYNDQVLKAGMTALIPTTDDPKVGVAQLSAALVAERAKFVYGSMERIINWAIEELNLKTPLRFKMFGDIFSAKEEIESARKGMINGCLIDTLKYDAIQGHSILDDIAISEFVDKSGVMDKRRPLITSYSAKQEQSGLPPQAGEGTKGLSPEAKKEISEDGRPPEDGSINGETHEQS